MLFSLYKFTSAEMAVGRELMENYEIRYLEQETVIQVLLKFELVGEDYALESWHFRTIFRINSSTSSVVVSNWMLITSNFDEITIKILKDGLYSLKLNSSSFHFRG